MCATLLTGGGSGIQPAKEWPERYSSSIYTNEGYAYTLYNKNKYIDFFNKKITKKMSEIINGVLGAATSLFGRTQDFGKQRSQQEQLSNDAARINYVWGEKAARSAYNRQMEMYERTLEDNSYAARRKQLEDAGLSVGLMYGQAGAQGGGAGSLGGGTQGTTGGAKAADATAIAGLALQQKQIKLQEIATIADANLKNAQAKAAYAAAGRTQQEIDINEFQRLYNKQKEWMAKYFVEGDYESWRFQRMQNKLNYYFDAWKKTGAGEKGWDHEIGDWDFTTSQEGKMIQETLSDIVSEIGYREKNKEVIELEKTLKKEQAFAAFMNVVIAAEANDINKMRAETEKFVAKYQTGEEWNWKTIVDVIAKLVPGINIFKGKGK